MIAKAAGVTIIWVGIGGMLAEMGQFASACELSQGQERRSNVTNRISSSEQALIAAYAAIKDSPISQRAGDILVKVHAGVFEVRFQFVTDADRHRDRIVDVNVSALGDVAIKQESTVDNLNATPAADDCQKFLTAKQAYDLAKAAMGEFEQYDKLGELTIKLMSDKYVITFPLPPRSEDGLSADFAMQIEIDARNGKVLRKLVAS